MEGTPKPMSNNQGFIRSQVESAKNVGTIAVAV
jgi:hypothetical protein